jgi:MFS family permease
VLTGAGGALFSPALEAQLSHADRPERGRSVFVWLAVTGEIGAVLGPLLGSALLGWGLDAALTAGIVVFTAVTAVLWRLLPDPGPGTDGIPAPSRARPSLLCLRDRRFVAFCALAGVNLLAYNQLYFAVPVELDRRGLDPAWLGPLFGLASVLTLVLQLPVAAAARRLGPGRTLTAGFGLLAVAFAVAATTSVHPGDPSQAPAAPVVVTVAVLCLGHMALTPTILSLVPAFVPDTAGAGRAAYYGLVATCGGAAVLVGNTVLGRLVDAAARHQWWPGTPWAPPVLLALLAAVALPRVLRAGQERSPSDVPPAPPPRERTP